MTRKHAALGAAVGGLLAAGLVAALAGVLYLRAHNAGERAVVQAPADAYARALAEKTLQSRQNPTEVQELLLQLTDKNQAGIARAMVVVEPKSTKYRFLRNRRYLATSETARLGEKLDRRSPGDKAIYDLCNRVRQKGAQLRAEAPPEEPFTVQAARPVMVDGKHYATAIVVTRPEAPAVPVAGAGLLWALLAVGLLGLIGGSSLPRGRYLLVLAGVGGYTFFSGRLLTQLHDGYRALLQGRAAELAAALGVPAEQVASRVLDIHKVLPAVPVWTLGLALIPAVALCVAGHRGLGGRFSRAAVQHRFAYSYILPVAAAMLLLVFIPFGYGLVLGFFNHDHGTYTFVGLANFIEVLSGGGRPLSHPLNFYFTLAVTVAWTAINVFFHVAIGLSLALILKDPLLGFKGVYRVLLILPWAVPNYITALIWKGMFHYQYGAVNHMLELLGIEKVSWFSSFSTAFIANVTTNTWLGFPFMMVVSLGALQSIPSDVYEAASVDGASRWQSFWSITMPLLKPALFPAIVLGTIWTFNQFNIIYLVSEGAPAGASDILITEAYRWAFERADRYGLAAAYALIIFVILFLYTIFANRIARASEETY